MLSCQAHGGIDTARQTGKNLVCWLLWSDGSHFSAWALYPAERRWTLMKKVGRQHSALLCCFAQTGVCFFFQLFKKWSVIYSTFNLIVIAKKIPKNKLKYIYHTYLCVSRNRNSQPSQEERELMSVWHFAGICGALNHFYVWDLGFWYLPLPVSLSFWPGIQIVGPSMCAAAAGQYRAWGFSSQLLSRHKFVVKSQLSSNGQVRCRFWRYNKENFRQTDREKQEWKWSDGVAGDIMSIYAETHVQDLQTFFG